MKTPLLYIIESIVCSGIFFAIYQLFVMRYTSFKVNRFFLLAGIFMSCVIPAMQIPVWSGNVLFVETVKSVDEVSATILPTEEHNIYKFSGFIFFIIYVSGFILVLSYLLKELFSTYRIRKHSLLVESDNCIIAYNDSINTPFSFMNTIYLPVIDDNRELRQVLTHERSHIKHKHSQERLFLESLKLFCWFNPFVWFSMRKLIETQEMEADRDVLNAGYDVTEYRTMLLKQVLGGNVDIACNLTGHPLKNRFLAMTRIRTEQNARAMIMVPFLFVAVVVFAFVKKPDEIKYLQKTSEVSVVNESHSSCRINGKVTDKLTGEPIAGAVIKDLSSTQGLVTDMDGRFEFVVQNGSELAVVYPDYEKGLILVGDDDEQVVNISLVHSASSVKTEKEIAVQKDSSSEFKNEKPLILANGHVYNKSLDEIAADKIKSVTVFKVGNKLKPYIDKYGDAARNGVIVIELKE